MKMKLLSAFLFFNTLIFSDLYAQSIQRQICNSENSETISIDLQEFQSELESGNYNFTDVEASVIYTTVEFKGIGKIVNVPDQPELQEFCYNVTGITQYKKLAINSNQEIYFSSNENTEGASIFKIDPNCNLTPIYQDYTDNIGSIIAFDNADNLYITEGYGVDGIFRADSDDLSHFYLWHDFDDPGFPTSGMMEKDGYLYLIWYNDNARSLFKITVDEDYQYVSHENIGQLIDNPTDILVENGNIYVLTEFALHTLDLDTMTITPIYNHPGPDLNSRRFIGADGFHKNENELIIEYYENQQDAEQGQNQLSSPYIINNVNGITTLFAKVKSTSSSEYAIVQIEIEIITPPSIELPSTYTSCSDEPVQLQTNLDPNLTIQWFYNGTLMEGANSPNLSVNEYGEYRVQAYENESCSSSAQTVFTESSLEIESFNFIENRGVEINVSGPNQPFEYQVDNGIWQSSNIFENLSTGEHIFIARNSVNCYSDELIVNIKFSSNTITPNEDGINDVFYFPSYSDYSGKYYEIKDRFGKSVVSKTQLSENSYWDGYYSRRSMPTQTYWYFIWDEDQLIHQGYILVKNY